METEIRGKFVYEQDSKRYHRFQIETDTGVVGVLYIPKNMQPLPERVALNRVDEEVRPR